MPWSDKSVSPCVYTPAAAELNGWELSDGLSLQDGQVGFIDPDWNESRIDTLKKWMTRTFLSGSDSISTVTRTTGPVTDGVIHAYMVPDGNVILIRENEIVLLYSTATNTLTTLKTLSAPAIGAVMISTTKIAIILGSTNQIVIYDYTTNSSNAITSARSLVGYRKGATVGSHLVLFPYLESAPIIYMNTNTFEITTGPNVTYIDGAAKLFDGRILVLPGNLGNYWFIDSDLNVTQGPSVKLNAFAPRILPSGDVVSVSVTSYNYGNCVTSGGELTQFPVPWASSGFVLCSNGRLLVVPWADNYQYYSRDLARWTDTGIKASSARSAKGILLPNGKTLTFPYYSGAIDLLDFGAPPVSIKALINPWINGIN